jgi:hypothetical protein
MNKCSLFQNDSTRLVSPDRVQSHVSLSIFRQFISELDGNAIKITDTNYTELQQLWKEFCFSQIADKFSESSPSMDLKETQTETEDADPHG